ncbi:MAG: nicotinate (nicotinamide) nucleotide adenylyltransferase [Rickettsiales bacterium]
MKPLYLKNRVVGLLGGSFNPAHEGHLHISEHALKKLGMDEVWWLVSPHNPLKNKDDLADYKKRMDSAKAQARHKHIYVTDLESRCGLTHTWQTVAYLQGRYPATHFVWMMGADNLSQFHRWENWEWLCENIPIVVFDRVPYSHNSKHEKTYQRMRPFLLKDNELIGDFEAPALRFIHMKRNNTSATSLRNSLGKQAFLGHNKGVGQV